MAGPWEKYASATVEQDGPWSKYKSASLPADDAPTVNRPVNPPWEAYGQPMTLQQRAQGVFGFDPNIKERGTILPVGRDASGRNTLAMPQVGVDMMTSFLLPGHVAQGGDATVGDTTNFTLDYLLPQTMGKATGPEARTVPTKSEFIKAAPTSEQLAAKGAALFQSAKNSGVAISPERYTKFIDDVGGTLAKEGLDPMLHSKASAVLNAMAKRTGDVVDIGDLQTVRRQIGIAARSTAPELADERRLAMIMQDKLDDMINGLSGADLTAGTAADATAAANTLREARSLWGKSKKSEIIGDILEKAKTQASGEENGIRIGFRQLLNNKKAIRGFSGDEIAAIKDVVDGGPVTKVLRLVGKLSPYKEGAQNIVGGAIGVGAGSAAGGPIGGVGVPLAAYAAQKSAESMTRKNAEMVRALAASGGKLPPSVPLDQSAMAKALMGASGPIAAGTIPRDPNARSSLIRLFMGTPNMGGA